MKEYIERDRARFEFERFFKEQETVQHDCDSLLCMLPAADVVERKRGEWESTMVAPTGELVRWTHVHKECGYLYTDLRTRGHNFCPNCGADMWHKEV